MRIIGIGVRLFLSAVSGAIALGHGYGTGSNPRSAYVNPYQRSDGRFVDGYHRTVPNRTDLDNYGTRRNYNLGKAERKDFFASYKRFIDFSSKVLTNGLVKLAITIGPDRSHHPGNFAILASLLQEAREQGFKLLRCPRIGGLLNPESISSS